VTICFAFVLLSMSSWNECGNRYLEDYQSVVEEGVTNEEEFNERVAGNPIHAYRLMKRLYFDWQIIENEIRNDHWQSKCDTDVL